MHDVKNNQRRSQATYNLIKNILRLVFILAVLSATTLLATRTRSQGMALSNDFNWMVSNQFSYLFLNPAYITYYKNQFSFEHNVEGVEEFNSGGLFLAIFNNVTLGLFLGERVNEKIFNSSNDPMGFFYSSGTNLITNNTILNLNTSVINSNGLSLAENVNIFQNTRNNLKNKNLQSFLGYNISSLRFGAQVSYGFVRDVQLRNAVVSEELSLNKSQLDLGLGVVYKNKIWLFRSIDLSLGFISYQLNNVYNENDLNSANIEASKVSDGAGQYRLATKVRFKIHRQHYLNLFYKYQRSNSNTISVAKSDVSNGIVPFHFQEQHLRKSSSHTLGLSDEVHASKTVLVFLGLQIEYESLTHDFDGEDLLNRRYLATPYQAEFDSLFIPIVLGLEGQLSKMFTVRFGLSHGIKTRASSSYNQIITNLNRGSADSNNTSASAAIVSSRSTLVSGSSPSTSRVSIGLSINVDRFKIDWLGNVDFFRDGPYFISASANELSTSIALSYYFGKGRLFAE